MTTTHHVLRPRPYPSRLSLVIPIYNEESTIPFLRRELERFMAEVPGTTEVILVNDGSSDESLPRLLEWASETPEIKVLQLSRNFGHQLAATAGLDYATGDAVVLLDADLQDPLDVIHQMIERYCEGYDVVYGQRASRAGETRFKLFTAWFFYRLMRTVVYKQLPVDTGDFRLISRHCLDQLKQLRETHRFLRGMVAWVGFPQIAVKYCRRQRVAGESKYPLRKMLMFAWIAATSFSTLPLKFSFGMGLLIGAIALEEAVRALLATAFGWYTISGWASLMVITCVIGSSLLISIGIVGDYLGKIYEQAKGRPLYLISQTFNVDTDVEGQRMIPQTSQQYAGFSSTLAVSNSSRSES